MIYVYSTVVGILLMVEIPSRRAYMSGIVGPAALGSALALDMVSLNVAWFIGSNLGGVVAKLMNPAHAYGVISVVFAASFRFCQNSALNLVFAIKAALDVDLLRTKTNVRRTRFGIKWP
jgi:hypothetical protein